VLRHVEDLLSQLRCLLLYVEYSCYSTHSFYKV
jgi:hypothetical protein